jgi:hypothetical protein
MAQTFEEVVRTARQTIEARRSPPPQRRQNIALEIVNAGLKARGLDSLATLPDRGPEQPRTGPIDVVETAAAVVRAGKVARGEIPVPLPADPIARGIVLAGLRARGIEVS